MPQKHGALSGRTQFPTTPRGTNAPPTDLGPGDETPGRAPEGHPRTCKPTGRRAYARAARDLDYLPIWKSDYRGRATVHMSRARGHARASQGRRLHVKVNQHGRWRRSAEVTTVASADLSLRSGGFTSRRPVRRPIGIRSASPFPGSPPPPPDARPRRRRPWRGPAACGRSRPSPAGPRRSPRGI